MKICFAIQDMNLGGSSTVVYDVIQNWNNEDELYLLLFFDDLNPRYISLKEKENLTIRFLGKQKTVDFPFLKRLKALLTEISPDVISSHLTCTFYIALVCKNKNTAIFHTIHNRPNKDLPWIYRLFLKRRIKKGKIHLIGCGESVSAESRSLYGVPVHTIQNGIELGTNSRLNLADSPSKVTFLSVGRLTSVKSVLDAVTAFSMLKMDRCSARLLIAGYGPEEEAIKHEIQRLGLEKEIEFLGRIADPSDLYRKSDVFLLLSEREGSPIVLLESKKYGLAIIATDVAGSRDLVEDGKTGLLVPTHCPERAAEAMQHLVDDPAFLRMLKENSFRDRLNYDAKHMSEEYYNFFIQMVGRKNV
ncbi:MAG: glycosyltransferase family 4 protein [Candidatus Enteromonas sp.]